MNVMSYNKNILKELLLVRKTSWYQMCLSSFVFSIRCKTKCEILKNERLCQKKGGKKRKPKSKKPSSNFLQGFSIDEALA